MVAIHTRNGADIREGALRTFSTRPADAEHRLAEMYRGMVRARKGHLFESFVDHGLREGRINHNHISTQALFCAFVERGRDVMFELLDPRRPSSVTLREANVDTAAFANIQGQIIYNRLLAGYQNPAFIGDKLVETIPTPFNGEKIAGITNLGDTAATVNEGAVYPDAVVGEDYITTPATTKRGMIVNVTKEAVFFDRTGDVLRQSGTVGYDLGLNREKRILALVVGVTNNYSRKGFGVENTYQSAVSLPDVDWINIKATNGFTDWESIEAAKALLDAMLDPNTGEPMATDIPQIVVPEALRTRADLVIGATQVRTGTDPVTLSPNPFATKQVESNQFVDAAQGNGTTWYCGNFKRAFAYMENWPITVTQSLMGSEAEFTKDIIARYKASERGNAAVIDPRYVVKNTA